MNADEIMQGVNIAIEVLRRAHPDFNPNIDESYSGLDEQACNILLRALEMLYGIKGEIITGGIKHGCSVPSSLWSTKHQWVYADGYHIDITCSQYSKYFKDIPSIYINSKKPKWFIVYQWTLPGRICDVIYKLKYRRGR